VISLHQCLYAFQYESNV